MDHTEAIAAEALSILTLTEGDLRSYLAEKQAAGLKATAAAKYRSGLYQLHQWLPEDKVITKELLLQWRCRLENAGYSKATVEKQVTYINLYTKHYGHPELNIKKSKAYELRGKQFGYLTAIEPVEKRNRADVVWRCQCKCGKELEVPAGLLVRGNTASCGCLIADVLDYHNRYVDGTELRKSMADDPISTRAKSGYTGVTQARGKWLAYITYKKKRRNLGYYTKLEDAVKARRRAKEEVMADAEQLYAATDHLYKEKPGRKAYSEKAIPPVVPAYPARRSDNTCGHSGVKREGKRWKAEISLNGTRYHLGLYDVFAEAVAVRERAETLVLSKDEKGIAAMSISATHYQIKATKENREKEGSNRYAG